MGGHDQPGQPTAYSYRTTWDQDGGSHADGYNIVIDPGRLQGSINDFKKQLEGQNSFQLVNSLTEAMGVSEAFGDIPNAASARNELTKFIQTHADEMNKMSSQTLVEFIARVQAAAQLGYDSDPATRAAAARGHGHLMME